MTDIARELVLGFGEVLSNLRMCSAPATRVAQHFLSRDINETYHFAVMNAALLAPADFEAEEVVDARMRGHDGVGLNGLRSVGHDGVDARVRV